MLNRLSKLSFDVSNIIFYINSSALEYIIKDILKEKFDVDRNFVNNIDTFKKLTTAKMDSLVAPMYGGKWLLHVNSEKIIKKDLIKSLSFNTSNAVTVYWVSKYRTYMELMESDVVKKQGTNCLSFYAGKLSYSDIKVLYQRLLRGEGLDKTLFNYVASTYNYDVEAVVRLFILMKSGNEVKSKKDIIDLVGQGGNTVDSFVVGLLLVDWDNEKKLKRALNKNLRLLQDLSYSYKFNTIRNYMLNTLEGFIEIKQLQIMGYYRKFNSIIPENFNDKRMLRLRRFEWFVLEKVTLAQLLNLKLILKRFDNFNVQVSLIQSIVYYIFSVRGEMV